MSRIAVYPGSFDPFHNGHLDIVERCRPLFDEVVVVVLYNTSKTSLFTPDERVEMIAEVLRDVDGCRVESFSGLLVQYMDRLGARVTVRGLRSISDFESELGMALMNRRLDRRVETVFLTPREEYSYLSSRLVREIYLLGGEVAELLPATVAARLVERVRRDHPAEPAG